MEKMCLEPDNFRLRMTLLEFMFINNSKKESIIGMCMQQWRKL